MFEILYCTLFERNYFIPYRTLFHKITINPCSCLFNIINVPITGFTE